MYGGHAMTKLNVFNGTGTSRKSEMCNDDAKYKQRKRQKIFGSTERFMRIQAKKSIQNLNFIHHI